MKKIFKFFAAVLSAVLSIVILASCTVDSLEWHKLPKSVYYVNEITKDDFTAQVEIKINNMDPIPLSAAIEDFNVLFEGFDLSTAGHRVIKVKYRSISIYWSYQVINDETEDPKAIEPDISWYDDSLNVFTLTREEQLYGLAKLVNSEGKNFDGKTVKLGKDMDLTGKIWTPIGQGVRKQLEPATFEEVKAKINSITDVSKRRIPLPDNEDALKSSLDSLTFNPELDYRDDGYEYFYIASYTFAKKNSEGDYQFYYCSDDVSGNFFQGTFDGQGHKIKGLSDIGYTPLTTNVYANSSRVIKGYVFGLFGIVRANVTIKNIIFENVNVIGAYYDANSKDVKLADIDSVGAAAAYVFGTGDATFSNIKVLSGSITASNAASGIVARLYPTGNILIEDCENHANISLNGNGSHVGGISGFITSSNVTFRNNSNYGNLSVNYLYAGGIIHYVEGRASLINCKNFGSINRAKDTGIGKGLVGRNYGAYTYSDNANYGNVTIID